MQCQACFVLLGITIWKFGAAKICKLSLEAPAHHSLSSAGRSHLPHQMSRCPPSTLSGLILIDRKVQAGLFLPKKRLPSAGSCHLPVQQLSGALQWSPSAFEAAFHFPKPTVDQILIFQSRTGARAAWAAQVAKDAGFKHSLVYNEVRL